MVTTETYGKYITQDWQKIKPHDFPDYFDKLIKLTGFIQWVIVIQKVLLRTH